MGFRNHFATATLPARLRLYRPDDVVEGARLMGDHFETIERRAGEVSPAVLRWAYGSYRFTFRRFGWGSPLVYATAALGRAENDGATDAASLLRVEGVVAAAVDLLLACERGTPLSLAVSRGPAVGFDGLREIIGDIGLAASVALLAQAFANASRVAEVVKFPKGDNRRGNDA